MTPTTWTSASRAAAVLFLLMAGGFMALAGIRLLVLHSDTALVSALCAVAAAGCAVTCAVLGRHQADAEILR